MKTLLVYLGVSALCILIDTVYALYGHGVYSRWMSLMFLYPLVGGALVFSLLWLLMPAADATPNYRVHYTLYNSGVATLTIGSLLQGIFDIAGTSSPYTVVFYIVGGLFAAAGVVGFFAREKKYKKNHSPVI